MKKLIFSSLSALLLVACSDEEQLFVTESVGTLYLSVEIPSFDDMRTRAGGTFGDGSTVSQLRYYIYDADSKSNSEPILSDDVSIVNYSGYRGAVVDVQLPKDKEYDIVFLATAVDQTNSDSKVYYNQTARTLNVDYGKISSNDESVDCFYAVANGVSTDSYNYSVTMKRPFAQLNIGDKSTTSSTDIKTAGVTVKGVYSSMSIMDGSLAGNAVNVTLAPSALPLDYSFPVSGVGYIAMNYLLVNEQKEVDVTLTTTDSKGTGTTDFTKVPLKRNCQTNIYGNLFEVDNDFVIEINPDFGNESVNTQFSVPYEDYDLVLTTTGKDSEFIYLKVQYDSYSYTAIDLKPYEDSNNMIKVTWNELGLDKAYSINFSNDDGLKEVLKCDINKLGVTSLYQMFYWCKNLISVDAVKSWDTSNITSLERTFCLCQSLESLDLSNWDTSNVTNLHNTFNQCYELTSLDVSNWDTSNVTTLEAAFTNCESLTSLDVSNWNTSKVTTLKQTFYGCSKLTSLDVSNWDTSNVTSLNSTFYVCGSLTSLDLSNWNTSKVTTLYATFEGCLNLTSLDVQKWDVSEVTEFRYTFLFCRSLTSLDLSNWDVSKIEDFDVPFEGCTSLTSINLANWNFINADRLDLFPYCNSLTTVIGPVYNISCSVDLVDSPLDNESAMVFINGLLKNHLQNIYFSEETYSTLTDEQKEIAENKLYTVHNGLDDE